MKTLLLSLLLVPGMVVAQGPTRYNPGDADSVSASALKSFTNQGLDTATRLDAIVYLGERMAYGAEPLDAELKKSAGAAAAKFLTGEAHKFSHVSLWEMRYGAVAVVDRSELSGADAVAALAWAADQSREAVVRVRIRAVQALSRRAHAEQAALASLLKVADVKSEPAADVRRWALNGVAQAAQGNPQIAKDDEVIRFVMHVLQNDAALDRWAGGALGVMNLNAASQETQARLRGMLAGNPARLSHEETVQRYVIDAMIRQPLKNKETASTLTAKLAAGHYLNRAAAAEALGAMGALGEEKTDAETVTALSNAMLRDRRPYVRGRAATALGCFGAAGRCADFALKSAFEKEWDHGVRQRINVTRRRLSGLPEAPAIVIPEGARGPVYFDAPINNGIIRR